MRTHLLYLFLLFSHISCSSSDVKASFPARAGGDDPAQLCGPYTGRIVDGDDKSPVAGAFVHGTWSTRNTLGASPMERGTSSVTVNSDVDGTYRIPGQSCRGATDFQLLVYKKGFVAYRSDRRYRDFGPRKDFGQKGQTISLRRWDSSLSHVRHLQYVGNHPATLALTQWEVPLASAERNQTRNAGPTSNPFQGKKRIPATRLLSEALIRRATQYDGRFETGPLEDEPDTDGYSSQHFRAVDKPASFDIALRVWTLPTKEEASDRYDAVSSLSSNSEDRTNWVKGEMDRAFFAKEGATLAAGALNSQTQVVLFLTCGSDLCKNESVIATILRDIQLRLGGAQ